MQEFLYLLLTHEWLHPLSQAELLFNDFLQLFKRITPKGRNRFHGLRSLTLQLLPICRIVDWLSSYSIKFTYTTTFMPCLLFIWIPVVLVLI